jgi:hypothetical protein
MNSSLVVTTCIFVDLNVAGVYIENQQSSRRHRSHIGSRQEYQSKRKFSYGLSSEHRNNRVRWCANRFDRVKDMAEEDTSTADDFGEKKLDVLQRQTLAVRGVVVVLK